MRQLTIIFTLLGAVVLSAGAIAFAQHETAADLLDGERAYRDRCMTCHGPNGDLVQGIDFGRGQFRRPMADADIVSTIRQGIPNTAMSAINVTEAQAGQIVAYLRSLAAAKPAATLVGDAARGKVVYETKGKCASCHSLGGVGGRLGPDLSSVGASRRTADLERAILDPQADVQPDQRTYRVVLKDGTTVTGRLLGYDTFNVRLLDTQEQLRSFIKSDLKSHGFAESSMPSYRNTLTAQEIADVVSFLSSLRPAR